MPETTDNATDLLGVLFEEYRKEENYPAGDKAAIDAFVAFSRKFLKEHPPISTFYHTTGLGINLQGGLEVLFAEDSEQPQKGASWVAAVPTKKEIGQKGMPGGQASHVPITK